MYDDSGSSKESRVGAGVYFAFDIAVVVSKAGERQRRKKEICRLS